MAETTELWLVRHGETEWSATGKHTGSTEVPLTENGRRQAAAAGGLLRGETFAAVLRSPMQRAQETCDLAGYGAQAQVEEGLREWSYGVYEGRTTKEIQAEIPGWDVWTNEIVNGETVEHVGRRADEVIARALGEVPEGKVLLFAHAHILRILAARWIGLEARDGRLFALGTGTVSVLAWERTTRVVRHWNRAPGEGF